MNVVFTPHIINTLKSLPAGDRSVITSALASEFILGDDPLADLTPFQSMIYSLVRTYVKVQ